MEPASDGDGRVLTEQSYNHYRPLVRLLDLQTLLRVFYAQTFDFTYLLHIIGYEAKNNFYIRYSYKASLL